VACFGVAAAGYFLAASGARPGCLARGERLVFLQPSLANPGRQAPVCDLGPQLVAAVAAVGQKRSWFVARLEQAIEQRQQVATLVFVAGPDPYCERPAVAVNSEVVLARGEAAIDRAWAG
jgi:hypothetical protein